jgi:hypothetical protein
MKTLFYVVVTRHTQIGRIQHTVMENIQKRRKSSIKKSINAKSSYRRRSA